MNRITSHLNTKLIEEYEASGKFPIYYNIGIVCEIKEILDMKKAGGELVIYDCKYSEVSDPIKNRCVYIESPIRGFYVSSRAWYVEVHRQHNFKIDDILVGLYHEEGGCDGEFSFIPHDNSYRLNCYEDSFTALSQFTDLIKALGRYDNQEVTEDKMVEILLSCGLKDLTKYEMEN